MRFRLLTISALIAILAVLALLGHASNSGTNQVSSRTSSSGAMPTKVLVVIEENHSLTQMRAGMPYLAELSDKYGYATNWSAVTHPSEPNYLAVIAGSTLGIANDRSPAANASRIGMASSVFSQARRAGKSARTYAESAPHRCARSNAGLYAVRHNPSTYFTADRHSCQKNDLSTATFARDARANRLPNVGFLIPNLAHDAHDGSLATADRWLKGRLAPVLASMDFTTGKLVVIVMADEDDQHSGNTVLVSVLSPRLHHRVVRTPLTKRTMFVAGALGAAVAVGATGIAVAGDGDDGSASDNYTQEQADAAATAALEETGGGRVNSIESDGENGATYEVEVTKTDGTTVDGRLDGEY